MKRHAIAVLFCGAFAGHLGAATPAPRSDLLAGIALNTPLPTATKTMTQRLLGARLQDELLLDKVRRIAVTSEHDGSTEQIHAVYGLKQVATGPYLVEHWFQYKPDFRPSVESVLQRLIAQHGVPNSRDKFEQPDHEITLKKLPAGSRAFVHRLLWSPKGSVTAAGDSDCRGGRCGNRFLYIDVYTITTPLATEERVETIEAQLVDDSIRYKLLGG